MTIYTTSDKRHASNPGMALVVFTRRLFFLKGTSETIALADEMSFGVCFQMQAKTPKLRSRHLETHSKEIPHN